jgi:hypothetical protein
MERSGIDMVFRAAKKKYPFLVDWDFNLKEEYSTITPIILRVNQDMICKHFGYEKKNRYANGFGNFDWVIKCDVIEGQRIIEEIRRFFENGYDMIPIENCIINELFNEGQSKRLSVGLCYFI